MAIAWQRSHHLARGMRLNLQRKELAWQMTLTLSQLGVVDPPSTDWGQHAKHTCDQTGNRTKNKDERCMPSCGHGTRMPDYCDAIFGSTWSQTMACVCDSGLGQYDLRVMCDIQNSPNPCGIKPQLHELPQLAPNQSHRRSGINCTSHYTPTPKTTRNQLCHTMNLCNDGRRQTLDAQTTSTTRRRGLLANKYSRTEAWMWHHPVVFARQLCMHADRFRSISGQDTTHQIIRRDRLTMQNESMQGH